uniref:Putative restriction endonuclease n=1 Tax=uncultured marine thaumarchaeote KM3_06_C02 TaxID=1455976 RepID=A0A075G4X8_9ARCH|nr:putative restriction endonuclease [uncultured marine thaumarchaeote KM3_06_C02]
MKPDNTERKGLVTSRIGQGYYRELILRRWGRQCSVSHCSIDNVLIASHIVPWIESNKDEKLNVGNGILLSPNLDALFDKHLISFNEKGNILISKKLDKDNLEKLGVTKDMCLQRVFDDMIPFLLRHKSKFIEKEKL